jgi:hypothetical protein
VLGPGEDQRPVAAARQRADDGQPVRGGDGKQVMADLGGRRGRVNGVPRGLVQEAPYKDVDRVVECRREQHPLALRRRGLEEAPHHGQEPQVGHVVRLVEHGDLDVAQVAVALLDEVGEPPRAGDDDIGAVAQVGHLGALRGTPEDRRDAEADGPGQRQQNVPDLAGKFACRQEHQAARTACHGVPVGEPRDERECIAERLT